MATDLFVSYSRRDWDLVTPWIERLQGAGVSVWVDKSGIHGAFLWTSEIAQAIEESQVMILLVSSTSVASKHVVREVTLAHETNKPILPLLLEPIEIPLALRYP